MAYNTTRKVRTKDLKSLAAKVKAFNDDVKSSIGTLSSLTTSTKTNLVAAVNAVKTLADTAQSTADTAKTNAATAQSTANTAKTNAATAQSTADTAKTNAATANTNIGTLSSLTTSTKTNLVVAINAVKTLADTAQSTADTAKTNAATANTNIGTLSSLNTSAKGNLVAAINELNTRTAFINDVENTPYALRAGFHNSIFRGKYLGASVTDAQWAAIASGKFDDMFIGDYWVIGGIYYRIAHFDYYFNNRGLATKGFEDMNGDILSAECLDSYGYYPKHHILLIPDRHMCDAAMNTEDTKAELYGTCHYRINARRNIISTLEAAFGAAHLMYWVDNFTTTLYSYSDGSERAGERASFVCQAELPSSIQLTGTHAMTSRGVPVGEGGNLNEGRAPGQFALMRLNQAFRQPIDMRPGSMLWVDVSYNTRDFVGRGDDGRVNFGLWASHGVITYASGLAPHQIRPYFCIM